MKKSKYLKESEYREIASIETKLYLRKVWAYWVTFRQDLLQKLIQINFLKILIKQSKSAEGNQDRALTDVSDATQQSLTSSSRKSKGAQETVFSVVQDVLSDFGVKLSFIDESNALDFAKLIIELSSVLSKRKEAGLLPKSMEEELIEQEVKHLISIKYVRFFMIVENKLYMRQFKDAFGRVNRVQLAAKRFSRVVTQEVEVQKDVGSTLSIRVAKPVVAERADIVGVDRFLVPNKMAIGA